MKEIFQQMIKLYFSFYKNNFYLFITITYFIILGLLFYLNFYLNMKFSNFLLLVSVIILWFAWLFVAIIENYIINERTDILKLLMEIINKYKNFLLIINIGIAILLFSLFFLVNNKILFLLCYFFYFIFVCFLNFFILIIFRKNYTKIKKIFINEKCFFLLDKYYNDKKFLISNCIAIFLILFIGLTYKNIIPYLIFLHVFLNEVYIWSKRIKFYKCIMNF